MITNFISPAGRKILIAWETAGQVFYADVVPGTDGASESVAAPGPGSDRKHSPKLTRRNAPCLDERYRLAAGGSLEWQVFDQSGRPTDARGTAPEVPVWGLVAAYTQPDGGFTIIY